MINKFLMLLKYILENTSFFFYKSKKGTKKTKKAKKLNVNVLYSAASAIFLLRWGLFSPCSALLEPFVCKLCKAFINSFSL